MEGVKMEINNVKIEDVVENGINNGAERRARTFKEVFELAVEDSFTVEKKKEYRAGFAILLKSKNRLGKVFAVSLDQAMKMFPDHREQLILHFL